MQPIGHGVYHCPKCGNNHQQELHFKPAWIHPLGLVSVSSLSVAVPLMKATIPLLQHLPLALQIGGGLFIFMGYILAGVRGLGR